MVKLKVGRLDCSVELFRYPPWNVWFEAAVPGVGWLALDPTNRQAVGLRHVKIGHGRDYGDVAPLRGTYAGGASEMFVTVQMTELG